MIPFKSAATKIVIGALLGSLCGVLAGLYSDISLLAKVGELLGYIALAVNLVIMLILYFALFKKDMTGKDKYLYLLLGCLVLGVILGALVAFLRDPADTRRFVWMALTGMLGADLGILSGILLLVLNPYSQNTLKN